MNRILPLVLFLAVSLLVSAGNKLSSSTQLFIQERDGLIHLDEESPSFMASPDLIAKPGGPMRPIARRELVDGVWMVPAFVHIDSSRAGKFEDLGVVVQSRFDGFVTALVPVDKIEALAALDMVQYIDVAEVLEAETDQTRVVTNVNDVLNMTEASALAGMTTPFTGKGVVIGIIDSGIDFRHTAFQDANGNSRVKVACVGPDLTAYTSVDGLTTDQESNSHGTHTSSIAGGRNYTIDGVTYGGMAPECDLVLCGLTNLYNTSMANAVKYICDYADAHGQPCVVSMSVGSMMGPHDGTGIIADVTRQLTGENHVFVFSAGNYGGRGVAEGGGVFVSSTATVSSPLQTGLMSARFNNTTDDYCYTGNLIYASARRPNMPIVAQLHVIDNATSTVVKTWEFTSTTTLSDELHDYYSGELTVTLGTDYYSGKCYVRFNANKTMKSKKYEQIDLENGKNFKQSGYALAVSLYPGSESASETIDAWCNTAYTYFKSYANPIDGYQFVTGTSDCSNGIYSCDPNVICVGNYVARNQVEDVEGEVHTSSYTLDDISPSSSYTVAGVGPLNRNLPGVSAPGTMIVSAVNNFDTTFTNFVSLADNYPYGWMSGTSMATPCVAGIVALWMEAAKSVGMKLNTDSVRNIIAATAVTDQFTTGANAARFGGHGKINALAGVRYILRNAHPLKGDVNHDGKTDITDVSIIIDHLLAVEGTTCCTICGDMDGNGKVDITDVALLIDKLLAR